MQKGITLGRVPFENSVKSRGKRVLGPRQIGSQTIIFGPFSLIVAGNLVPDHRNFSRWSGAHRNVIVCRRCSLVSWKSMSEKCATVCTAIIIELLGGKKFSTNS